MYLIFVRFLVSLSKNSTSAGTSSDIEAVLCDIGLNKYGISLGHVTICIIVGWCESSLSHTVNYTLTTYDY